MNAKKIRIKVSGNESETAYVALPGYPDEPRYGSVARTVCLDDIICGFKGPRINLDFDNEGMLIGIEILA